MRYVTIEKTKPGMCLAYDLYDLKGRVVISSGATLTENYILRLKEFGFPGVYIDDEISDGVVLEPPISPSLRMEIEKCVKSVDVEGCINAAKSIVDELLSKDYVSFDMSDLRSFDDYTYAHSVNVAILCCAMGFEYGLDNAQITNLVTASLLHDMGKLLIDPAILNKKERLSHEEFEIMKTHAQKSYDLLAERMDLPAQVKQIVYLHHENEDGSGYPKGLRGEEIPFLVRIIHVCDTYDALISDRPYKKGYATSEAMEYLMGACGILFSKEVVEHFIHIIPLYPKGGEVMLSNGRACMVVDNSGVHNMRPLVRDLETGEDIDLAEAKNFSITIVTDNKEAEIYQEKKEAERVEMLSGEKHPKLLLVDDMVSNLQMLRDILSGKYEVILTKSGQQAIQYIKDHEYPDLILMDIDMPEMDGIEATRIINSITNYKVPVLFVTAVCDKETVLACMRLKASGYIAKPYSSVYVKSEVERILNGWVKA